MKQTAFSILLAVVAFAAGFYARCWTDRHRPLPPPPAFLMEEFRTTHLPPPAARPPDRAELAAAIGQLGPQIAAFRARLDQIDADFERDLAALLTPEQRAKHAESLKRRAAGRYDVKDDGKPLTDRQIAWLLQRPLYGMFRNVVLQMRFDELNRDLNFTPEQQVQVRDLLRRRRADFLNLVDATPPPSLTLLRLAPLAQRLAKPAP